MLHTLTSLRMHLKWAYRVLRSKNFVVLGDHESFIWFAGVDPESFNDALSVAGQRQALAEFAAYLDAVTAKHDEVLAHLYGDDKPKTKRGGSKGAKTKRSTPSRAGAQAAGPRRVAQPKRRPRQ